MPHDTLAERSSILPEDDSATLQGDAQEIRSWRLPTPPSLQALGDFLQREQKAVVRVQWFFAGLYAFLLLAPVLLPLPTEEARVFTSLARFSEALFWGFWWPAVLLCTLLFGQFWCGVLCPDGMLTEFASQRGKGKKTPAWIRWSGWPILGFSLLIVYEHVTDAYRSPSATLALLGGASLLAILTGALVGRSKRVWCRYLCPLANIFSLLSRCAIFHFHVDRTVWDSAPRLPRSQARAVDCPLLLDVRRLRSNEKCNMCGRCSGHRNAVQLAARAPGTEIVSLAAGQGEARRWEAVVIAFVLIGVSFGALHWRDSPWYHALGAWLTPLAGWPVALVSVLLPAGLLGCAIVVLLLFSGLSSLQRSVRLAYALIPLAGMGLFVGSLEYSFRILIREGIPVGDLLPMVRASFLIPALVWSLALGWLQLGGENSPPALRFVAMGFFLLAAGSLAACYQWVPSAL